MSLPLTSHGLFVLIAWGDLATAHFPARIEHHRGWSPPVTADEADDSYRTLGVGRSLASSHDIKHDISPRRREGYADSSCAAHYLLGWEVMPSWLAGVAMSTTSVAVVYAMMIEFGFNTTDYGETILAACFVTDLGTVVALGMIFAPFSMKTLIFLGVGVVVFIVLPWLTPRFFRLYGGRPSELEAKFLLLCLLGMGALATWADSEAVLPAYLIGMVLAGTVGKDHALVRRLRALTFGLLTPFYFIRAGSFVSIPALVAAPAAFICFLVVKTDIWHDLLTIRSFA
jgi:Kef-type K+ transport system membrane component KefB